MIVIGIFWLALAIAVGVAATKRGRSSGAWFLIAIIFSPLLAFIFLLVMKDLNNDSSKRLACPACTEKILLTANICPFCKSDVGNNPAFTAAVKQMIAQPAEDRNNLLIGIGFIVALIVIVKVIDSVF